MEPIRTALTIRLPRDLHTRARLKATKEHTSLQRVVEDAIRAYVGEAAVDDPDFERQMQIARAGMEKYRNALAQLAK